MSLGAAISLGWEAPALAAALAAGALAAALVGFARRRRGREASVPGACGKCGYDVRGLASFVCPECGSDLRQVGIVAGPAPGPLGLLVLAVRFGWRRLVIGTLALAALLAGGTYGALALLLPHDVYPAQHVVLEPGSQAYRVRLDMTADRYRVLGWRARAGGGPTRNPKLVVNLTRSGLPFDPNTDLHVDLTTWSATVYHWHQGTAPGTNPVNFNREELVKFYTEKSIDTSGPEAAAELDALMQVIGNCRTAWVQQAMGAAGRFWIESVKDGSEAQYAGSAPLGPLLVSGGLAGWVLLLAGLLIGGMWRLRDGAPGRAGRAPVLAGGVRGGGATRTLTVLFSDIKGYTARAAAAGREGATDLVRRHRDAAGPVLHARHGTLVKTMGDGLLAVFESATDAVLAGLEIQAAVAAQNAAAPGADLELRIAVASGEVIVEAGDVYGPTVNLAARLQGVARPGQVVVAAATRGLLNEREVPVEKAGEFELAGIAGKVEAWVARGSGQRSEVSGQWSVVSGQESGVRGQESGARSQRPEGGEAAR